MLGFAHVGLDEIERIETKINLNQQELHLGQTLRLGKVFQVVILPESQEHYCLLIPG